MRQVFNMVPLRGVFERKLQFGGECRAKDKMTVGEIICDWRESFADQTGSSVRKARSGETAEE